MQSVRNTVLYFVTVLCCVFGLVVVAAIDWRRPRTIQHCVRVILAFIRS